MSRRIFSQICSFKMLGLLAMLGIVLSGAAMARAEDHKDAKAVELAHLMMQNMGGENGWDKAHFVRFDFNVIKDGKMVMGRSHLWDKYTGRYRLESKTKEGKSEVVLFNSGTKEGSVYVDGKKVEGDDAKKALENAYGAFINDMYWLAEPWKWMDMGANLKYMGEKQLKGKAFDEVELTFGKVGLTPGDMYHAYVSRDSHLMTHWEYKLQGGQTGSWNWQYADTGGIKLAKTHISEDGKTEISMGGVRVLDNADGAYFTDPAKNLSGLK